MSVRRRLAAAIIAGTAALGLSACTDYYDPYGYGGSRVAVGISYGSGYHDPYWGGGWYSRPYYGWYDDFYYPGVGYWVFDRWGQRHRWNDHHRRYWEGHRRYMRDDRMWHRRPPNWSGWQGHPPRDWQHRRWRHR
jgi:hypothetical protein